MPLHDGVVVALHPSGDSTLVVELLTADCGRLSCVARGARNSKKRFEGGLDVLTRVHADVTPPRRGELHDLHSAQVTHAFLPLRADPLALGRAAYVAELACALSAREHATPGVFETVMGVMDALCAGPVHAGLLRFAEVQLLQAVGELPPTGNCVNCGEELLDRLLLDAHHPGHFYCERCAPPGAQVLSPSVAQLLSQCSQWDASQAARASVPDAVSQQAGRLLAAVIEPLLSKPLKSRRYLAQLQRSLQGL